MGGFHEYVDGLERLALGRDVPTAMEWRERLTVCLDGEPGQILRRVDESLLKRYGAYFTNAKLAARVANRVPVGDGLRRTYFDPTCGAGDLLLAVAKRLPVASTLTATVDDWGRSLSGFDISGDFVRAAKARLVLLAAKLCRVRPHFSAIDLTSVFPKIMEGDFLERSDHADGVDVVIMNPPFGYTRAPDDCWWTQGRVSAAAVFAEKAIQDARGGTKIVAILPDVLRSGTRYHRWRRMLDVLGTTRRRVPLGVFGHWADIDVYLLDFVKSDGPHNCDSVAEDDRDVQPGGVGRRFSVHVGAVVPHRHEETGAKAPYIQARSLPAWSEYRETIDERRFNGRLFEPPFVAVRRTSRPDQKNRAVATLVLGEDRVAVENHLIVLLPKNGTERTCRDLVSRLRSHRTNDWINRSLRCRHLTTGVLSGMPWWRNP